MKNLILVSILFLSSTSFAGDFLGGDGGTIQLNKSEVEALTTLSGDYARWEDLEEGFVQFSGAEIKEGKLLIDLDSSRLEINSVILNNGVEALMSRIIGGDMGGGGK